MDGTPAGEVSDELREDRLWSTSISWALLERVRAETHTAELPDRGLPSLDALHRAGALSLDPDLETLVAYDARLVAAAVATGPAVTQPGA